VTGEKVLIGYMRVSKADGSQSTNLQRDALIAAGVSLAHLYEDLASGRRDDRPGLAACLKALREGDTLIVWKLDRLGRDLRHLINTVHDLTARSVGLKVLTGHGAAVDTTTAAGKLVFGIFAALAEFERELISERTVAGLISARARGRKGGRPFKMTAAKLRRDKSSDCSLGNQLTLELGQRGKNTEHKLAGGSRRVDRRTVTGQDLQAHATRS
jgi:DNA invertase Pin-like site-specific DNA recombinase